MVGRSVPCYSLKFSHKAPHGFIGRAQALTVNDKTSLDKVALELIQWAMETPTLRPRLADSLLQMIRRSSLFTTTDSIWRFLRHFDDLSRAQIDALLEATIENYQIHGAECRIGNVEGGRGKLYPEVISAFIDKQANFDASTITASAFRQKFSK